MGEGLIIKDKDDSDLLVSGQAEAGVHTWAHASTHTSHTHTHSHSHTQTLPDSTGQGSAQGAPDHTAPAGLAQTGGGPLGSSGQQAAPTAGWQPGSRGAHGAQGLCPY